MPTVTVTGTSAIEDAKLVGSTSADKNYGGAGNGGTALNLNATSVWLIRVGAASIPAGVIDAAMLKVYCFSVSGTPAGGVAYAVKDANNWPEGTGSDAGQIQAGNCCHNFCKYNTQSWAGVVGCGSQGTDFDTDASPPALSSTASAFSTLALRTQWATDWRDAARVNNGIIIRQTGSNSAYLSTESASNQPYFEIDTLAPALGGKHAYDNPSTSHQYDKIRRA